MKIKNTDINICQLGLVALLLIIFPFSAVANSGDMDRDKKKKKHRHRDKAKIEQPVDPNDNGDVIVDDGGGDDDTNDPVLTLAELGEAIFTDTNLSNPAGQSCESCHTPSAGFADPDSGIPTSEGAIAGIFGSRNSPTAAYAQHIPALSPRVNGGFVGGLFWDGRVDTLEAQAGGPFLNPLEMNNADEQEVVLKLSQAEYAASFEAIFGAGVFNDVELAYQSMTEAIAEFERTDAFSPFSSKFDAVLTGADTFTEQEQNGFNLFVGQAQCTRCHVIDRNPTLFTNFRYFNIGVPANPDSPFLNLDSTLNPDGQAFIDLGLGAVVNDDAENGKFRVPTLRNVGITAPYMHNGVFNTLQEVVDFYNTRDVNNIVPELDENVNNGGNIGNLGLTDNEVQDIVAFLHTLSDDLPTTEE